MVHSDLHMNAKVVLLLLSSQMFGGFFHLAFLASFLSGKHKNKQNAQDINLPKGINLDPLSARMMTVNENGNF